MARYRVLDPETAELLVPRITTDDTVETCSSGEYFTADVGEAILAPSVRQGDVLYIKIRTARRPEPSTRFEAPGSLPEQTPDPPTASQRETVSQPSAGQERSMQQSHRPEASKHYIASGFLGLDGELEEETPDPPKPWWKRLVD